MERYTERWKAGIGLVRHMWRFFVQHADTDPGTMMPAMRQAFDACQAVWARMGETDRDIVRMYHTAPRERRALDVAVRNYAAQRGMSTDEIMAAVCRAWKAVALERGIADE